MRAHRFLRTALAAAALFTVSGCYRIRYVNPAPPEALPAWEGWHHSFFEGILDVSGPVDVSRICPQGFAVVESQTSLPNLIAVPTRGVWTPQTVKVTCAVYEPRQEPAW